MSILDVDAVDAVHAPAVGLETHRADTGIEDSRRPPPVQQYVEYRADHAAMVAEYKPKAGTEAGLGWFKQMNKAGSAAA